MFALLNGRWPRILRDGPDVAALEAAAEAGDEAALAAFGPAIEALVASTVASQEAAGLDLITDGQVRWPDPGAVVLRSIQLGEADESARLVRAWRATAALTDRIVAQVVPGPYSLGRRVTEGQDAAAREAFTLELAEHLGEQLVALVRAGCPMALIDEPAAVAIGTDEHERRLFSTAQSRLLADVADLHAMLVITGGSAWDAGAATILGAPYRSYLFDLIAGPDNWYLIRETPGDRGIVCAALEAPSNQDQGPTLDWAARYAASARGRGPDRVGLANASSLHTLSPEDAAEVLRTLAQAARLATLSPQEAVAEGIDPRAYSISLGRARRRRR